MILITGANGFVGHKLMELCKDTAASPSLRNVTKEMVNRMIEESNADVVVHTAAISDIGTCEADPEASYFANVQIPMYLAKACKKSDRKLICFSSWCARTTCAEHSPHIRTANRRCRAIPTQVKCSFGRLLRHDPVSLQ